MASTRKASRSRSVNDPSTSPASKKRKPNSPAPVTPDSLSNVDMSSTSMELVIESGDIEPGGFEEIEIQEELVTVDVTASADEDGLQVEDSLEDPVSMAQTTLSMDGGQIGNEDVAEIEKPSPVFIFKDPNFVHSSKGPGGNKRTRIWKNLKQIVAAERSLPWLSEDVTYGSIDAPPSFVPAKKYSDISGLEARYTDPQTKMRYSNTDEYRRVRMLPGDIITGCLTLRKASALVP